MVRRSDVPMKDRKETPALRARPLRSYVSATFHSERERVRAAVYHCAGLPRRREDHPERERVRQRYITAPDSAERKIRHVQESIHGYEFRRQREGS